MIKYSEEAEKSVLGALLNDGQSLVRIVSIIDGKDFYNKTHSIIFEAIVELFEQNVVIDIVSVGNKLKEQVEPHELTQLSLYTYTSAKIEHHAKIIKENSMLRQMKVIGENLVLESQEAGADAFEILSGIENKLMETSGVLRIKKPEPVNKLIHPVVELLEAIKRGERKTIGIETGIYKLDEYLSGFQNGDLITIAARPSIGKTSLALTIAKQVSIKEPVGFYSLEMSNEQILIRLLSMESGINSKAIREGTYPQVEFIQLHQAITKIHKLSLYIDDQSRQSILEIKAKTKLLISEFGVKIIFIDYLQLMNAPKAERRDLEIGKLTSGFKEMAKEYNIPIVILAQLSRATEARESKRPELSDLRESGSIENDSDVVIFIHRPEFYRKDTFEGGRSAKGIAEIGIAKHRNGATGIFDMAFDLYTTTFRNLETENRQIPMKTGTEKEF